MSTGPGIPRLVIRVGQGSHAGRLSELADEVVGLAHEVVLDAEDLPDGCLGVLADFVLAASAQTRITVCGLNGIQARELLRRGIRPAAILVGKVHQYRD